MRPLSSRYAQLNASAFPSHGADSEFDYLTNMRCATVVSNHNYFPSPQARDLGDGIFSKYNGRRMTFTVTETRSRLYGTKVTQAYVLKDIHSTRVNYNTSHLQSTQGGHLSPGALYREFEGSWHLLEDTSYCFHDSVPLYLPFARRNFRYERSLRPWWVILLAQRSVCWIALAERTISEESVYPSSSGERFGVSCPIRRKK